MRTNLDALRSVKRYLAIALGEEYEVRLDREEGSITLPMASVALTGPATTEGPAWEKLVTQPLSIYVTPVPATSGEEALGLAAEIETVLYEAIAIGVDEGRPNRIPLYDYEGVTFDEGSEARPGPDYLRVVDFSITNVPDQDDTRRLTVTADLRVQWRRRGRYPGGTKEVKEVMVDFTTS